MEVSALSMLSDVIELSIAPVFLLVAIGSFLNVMTQRLARVVDRSRVLEARLSAAEAGRRPDRADLLELQALGRRMEHANRATSLCAISAFLVAVDVMLLFVDGLFALDAILVATLLFIAAMATLILGLGFFLAEISLATTNLKVRTRAFAEQD